MGAVNYLNLQIISMSVFRFKVGVGLFCHKIKNIFL